MSLPAKRSGSKSEFSPEAIKALIANDGWATPRTLTPPGATRDGENPRLRPPTGCARRRPRAPRSGRCSQDFSIEVMPRTAAKVEDFRAILPAGTRVYVAHIDGTDVRRHAGHRPPAGGRGLRGHAARPGPGDRLAGRARRARRRLRRRRACARRWSSPAASPRRAGRSPRRCSSCAPAVFDARGFRRPARRRPPGGQPRHRPRRRRRRLPWTRCGRRAASSARPTPRWRSPPSSASRRRRSSPGRERLRHEGVTLPVHIGVAGPAKLQTMLKYAMSCGVGPSLRVLQRRAADLDQADAAVRARASSSARSPRTRRRIRTARSSGCTSSRSAASPPPPTTPARSPPGRAARWHEPDGAALRPRRHPRRHRPPAPRGVRRHPRRARPRADAGRVPRATSWAIRMGRSSARFFPGEDGGVLERKEAMFRDSLAASVEPVAGHPRAAGLGGGERRRLRRRHQRAAATTRVAMLAAAGLAAAPADGGHRRRMRGGEARLRRRTAPPWRRSARRRRGPSPSRTAAPGSAPPAAPAPTSSG